MRYESFVWTVPYRAAMESPMFWEDSCCDLQLRSRRIIAKHAAPSPISIFISKLEGAQQELDESDLWMELRADSGVLKPTLIHPLREETNELTAIFVTMTRT